MPAWWWSVPEYPPTLRAIATQILRYAVDDNWQKAHVLLAEVYRDWGTIAVPSLIMFWSRAVADHAADGNPTGAVTVGPTWEVATGRMGGPMPDRARWAFAITLASINRDTATFVNLIEELNDLTGEEAGRYIGTHLESAALQIRHMPRGYAKE